MMTNDLVPFLAGIAILILYLIFSAKTQRWERNYLGKSDGNIAHK